VSEVGEFGLIDVVAGMVAAGEKKGEAWDRLIVGIGDDAAAWHSEPGIQLATIDALVQDVHFRLGMISWEELGWKSLAVNLSDIAAMGGLPRYALVSLALPQNTDVRDIVLFYQGMLTLARQFEVAVVGGNISLAPVVTVNVAVLGSTKGPGGRLLKRAAARPGDKVAVTGSLGGAAGGLEMLERGLEFDTESTAALRRAFLRPFPRVKEARILVTKGVKAGIDISDGLVSDLSHICEASRLGATIQTDLIPVAQSLNANFGPKAADMALSGGEDYELLFTAPAHVVEAAATALEGRGCGVTVVGEMTLTGDTAVTLLDENGQEFTPATSGWDHFGAEKHGA